MYPNPKQIKQALPITYDQSEYDTQFCASLRIQKMEILTVQLLHCLLL